MELGGPTEQHRSEGEENGRIREIPPPRPFAIEALDGSIRSYRLRRPTLPELEAAREYHDNIERRRGIPSSQDAIGVLSTFMEAGEAERFIAAEDFSLYPRVVQGLLAMMEQAAQDTTDALKS